MEAITYAELFAYLSELGFIESSQSGFETVFEHPATGIVVVYSMVVGDQPVSNSDLLSAEIRLQHHGLLEGAIRDAIRPARIDRSAGGDVGHPAS